jgi:hypothetical protein
MAGDTVITILTILGLLIVVWLLMRCAPPEPVEQEDREGWR